MLELTAHRAPSSHLNSSISRLRLLWSVIIDILSSDADGEGTERKPSSDVDTCRWLGFNATQMILSAENCSSNSSKRTANEFKTRTWNWGRKRMQCLLFGVNAHTHLYRHTRHVLPCQSSNPDWQCFLGSQMFLLWTFSFIRFRKNAKHEHWNRLSGFPEASTLNFWFCSY